MESIEFDPQTLHGLHYSLEQFDDEVERRVALALQEHEEVSQGDVENTRFNLRREVYQEWTGADQDQMLRWETANSMQHIGYASSGYAVHNDTNPLLAPIHGFDLKDYTAICSKLASGVPEEDILKALGIEAVIWEELNTLWPKRMQEDTSFTVATLFGQYFALANEHPVLGSLDAASGAGGENLQRLAQDRYFYEELSAAREAAYEYGLDGAQWMLDEHGVSLSDFQGVAMQWMEHRNRTWDHDLEMQYQAHHQQMKQQYAQRFAAEQGGNVADDVEF